jgi:hypothetical protein
LQGFAVPPVGCPLTTRQNVRCTFDNRGPDVFVTTADFSADEAVGATTFMYRDRIAAVPD